MGARALHRELIRITPLASAPVKGMSQSGIRLAGAVGILRLRAVLRSAPDYLSTAAF